MGQEGWSRMKGKRSMERTCQGQGKGVVCNALCETEDGARECNSSNSSSACDCNDLLPLKNIKKPQTRLAIQA